MYVDSHRSDWPKPSTWFCRFNNFYYTRGLSVGVAACLSVVYNWQAQPPSAHHRPNCECLGWFLFYVTWFKLFCLFSLRDTLIISRFQELSLILNGTRKRRKVWSEEKLLWSKMCMDAFGTSTIFLQIKMLFFLPNSMYLKKIGFIWFRF